MRRMLDTGSCWRMLISRANRMTGVFPIASSSTSGQSSICFEGWRTAQATVRTGVKSSEVHRADGREWPHYNQFRLGGGCLVPFVCLWSLPENLI